MSTAVVEAQALVAGSRRIVVLTGAGISTDSGIPDFRGPKGLWTTNPKAEQTSNIEYYVRDAGGPSTGLAGPPELAGRAPPAQRRSPGPGGAGPTSVLHTLVTQNIDGLHQAAGIDPAQVVEVHGTIHEVVCLDCGARSPSGPTLERVRAGEADPACLACGGMLKSATISFGQPLVEADLDRAFEAAATCDLLLAIGSTLSVYPVAAMVPTARQAGASVVIVNAEPTEMDDLADVVVRGSISEVLPEILAADLDC